MFLNNIFLGTKSSKVILQLIYIYLLTNESSVQKVSEEEDEESLPELFPEPGVIIPGESEEDAVGSGRLKYSMLSTLSVNAKMT